MYVHAGSFAFPRNETPGGPEQRKVQTKKTVANYNEIISIRFHKYVKLTFEFMVCPLPATRKLLRMDLSLKVCNRI